MIPEFFRWPLKSPGDGESPNSPARHLTRRGFVAAAAALPLIGAEPRRPETSAFDLSLLYEPVVPNELFYVREHFPAPAVSTHEWNISIVRGQDPPITVKLEELLQGARQTLPATLECAENPAGGGLVSHAIWEGVSLAQLLKAHGRAKFVRLSGADGFQQYIPLAKAHHADTLLAFRMNGQTLPLSHGGPLRAVVPGWYGMDSVKWLRRIELLDSAPSREEYSRAARSLLTGESSGERIAAIQVKSAFSRPQNGAMISGRRFLLRGAAWTGEEMIRSVEVSVDDGASWLAAQFSKPQRYSWVLWEREWKIPGAGEYHLLVRATDDRGVTQPLVRQPNRVDSFEQNACQRITVTVS